MTEANQNLHHIDFRTWFSPSNYEAYIWQDEDNRFSISARRRFFSLYLLGGILVLACSFIGLDLKAADVEKPNNIHVLAARSIAESSSESRQEKIASEIALSFARELGRWSQPVLHKVQQLGGSNFSGAANQSAEEDFATNRGRVGSIESSSERSVENKASASGEEPSSKEHTTEKQLSGFGGGPGFEQPWIGTPSGGTDIPKGLAGSKNFIFEDMDALAQDIADSWSDKINPQLPDNPSEATSKFFPFGRDEVVNVQPTVEESPRSATKPEIFSGAGLFSDEEEPDSEGDALRVVDDYVDVKPPTETTAQQAGIDNGVADAFPDEIVPQITDESQPRNHREHTDYDLQGHFSDWIVPSDAYDSKLGEDTSPIGLQDAFFHVPEAISLAASPRFDAELAPAAWGDRYVSSDGEVTLEDGSVSNPTASAVLDWTSASGSLEKWDFGEAAIKAIEATLEEGGEDTSDVEARAEPESEEEPPRT